MEPSRKNDDCYFYYYSTCMKGDNCAFRHEPVALGNETMCTFWQQGKCVKPHCNYRHMELRKNRKQIPCYWETQPSGCRKPHCPFLHANPKDGAATDPNKAKDIAAILADSGLRDGVERPEDNSSRDRQEGGDGSDGDVGGPRRGSSQASSEASYVGSPPVDPVVVNFEEESDNESVPTSSPAKKSLRKRIHVKTLEEIRLEQIQAESAAFYGYKSGEDGPDEECPEDLKLTTRNGRELTTGNSWPRKNFQNGSAGGRVTLSLISRSAREKSDDLGFEVMSLSEIRKRRLREESESMVMLESKVNEVTRYAPADTSMPEGSESPNADSMPAKNLRKRSHSPIVFTCNPGVASKVESKEEVDSVGKESDCCDGVGPCKVDSVGQESGPPKKTRRLVRKGLDVIQSGSRPRAVRLLRNRIVPGEVVRQVPSSGSVRDSGADEMQCGDDDDSSVARHSTDVNTDSMEVSTIVPKSPCFVNASVEQRDFITKLDVADECANQCANVDEQSALDKELQLVDEDDDDFLGEGQEMVTSTSICVDEDIIQDIDEFLNN